MWLKEYGYYYKLQITNYNTWSNDHHFGNGFDSFENVMMRSNNNYYHLKQFEFHFESGLSIRLNAFFHRSHALGSTEKEKKTPKTKNCYMWFDVCDQTQMYLSFFVQQINYKFRFHSKKKYSVRNCSWRCNFNKNRPYVNVCQIISNSDTKSEREKNILHF